MNKKQWLSFAALGLLWGSTWIPAGVLAEQIPPLFAEAARFLVAALILLPSLFGKRLHLPRARPLRYLLLLSATMIAIPHLILLWARQNLPSATVAVLFAAMPLLVVLLTPLLEDQDVPQPVMPATIVGLGAIAFTLGASFNATQAAGAAVLFLAVAFTGVSTLLAHRELGQVNPLLSAIVLLAVAALLLFLASLALERGQPMHWNRPAAISVLALGAFGGALAFATYFWLLQHVAAYQAATVQWVQPLVAMMEGALLLRMRLSGIMICGSLITLVCLMIVMRARGKDDDTVSLRAI